MGWALGLGAFVGGILAYIVGHLEVWYLLPMVNDDHDNHSSGHQPTAAVIMPIWAVILFMTSLTGLLYALYGDQPDSFAILMCAAVFFTLIALIDLRYRLILNKVVYPAFVVVIIFHLLTGHDLRVILVGGGFALIIFLATAWVSPGGLGMGDVKLAVLIGVMLGFPGVLWALIVGVGLGGIVAVGLLIKTRSRTMTIPYAPSLCIGAMIALLSNPLILH